MTPSKRSLTDEEFAEALTGHLADQPNAHDDDVETLEVMRRALGEYRENLTQLVERRSAAQPSLAVQASRPGACYALPRWSSALLLVLVTGGLVRLNNFRTSRVEPVSQENAQLSERQQSSVVADIEADNRLLASIDRQLRSRGVSSVDSLGLREEAATQRSLSHGVAD